MTFAYFWKYSVLRFSARSSAGRTCLPSRVNRLASVTFTSSDFISSFNAVILSLHIVDRQTYLGIEMTSSGRYTYARDIFSKKAYKVLSRIKRSFSNSDTTTIKIINKLFDALVKPILLYGCEIWGPELLSYKTHFDKSTVELVHINFYKQTLNTPWCTENIACREELASIFSYWQRLLHKTANPLLNEAFHYPRRHSQFFYVLNIDQLIRMPSTSNMVNRQHIRNARYSLKKQQIGRKSSEYPREKYTYKEIKSDYLLEDYLKTIRNPAHGISIKKMRLGVHPLRIQTGKYEDNGGSIPVEDRTCLIYKR